MLLSESDTTVTLTIFTPLYNRASFLPMIYQSLCRQTCMDFEWLIVDDGSRDNAKAVVNDLISRAEHSFSIRYIYKENGGKHTAINLGAKEAHGELFLILDSDDELPPLCVKEVISQYRKVDKDPTICGVCGIMSHRNGTRIGTGFPKDELKASSLDLRYKLRVFGDLLEVLRTCCYREYPFPEIGGERFCAEALIYNNLSLKYKMWCFNKVVYYRDYLTGGLTDNIIKIRMNAPKSTMIYYASATTLPIPFMDRLRNAINYWRFRFCTKEKGLPKINAKWYFAFPLGYLMHLRDLNITDKNR